MKWSVLGLVLAGLTALFVWDVFLTPHPPLVDSWILVRKNQLATSRLAIDVDAQIANPTTNANVYVYAWSGGQIVGRMLDDRSQQHAIYRLRVSITPNSVTFSDATWGFRGHCRMRTGPISIGVTFQDSSHPEERYTFELRHELWVSSSDISLSRQGTGWCFRDGEWTQRPVDGEFHIDKIEAWEDEALKATLLPIAFDSSLHLSDLQRELAAAPSRSIASDMKLLPIHEDGRFTEDVEHLSREYLLTCEVPPDQARLTASERYSATRRAITTVLSEEVARKNAMVWDSMCSAIDDRADRSIVTFDSDTEVTPQELRRILLAVADDSSFSDPLIWPDADLGPGTKRPLREFRVSFLGVRGTSDAESSRLVREIRKKVNRNVAP